MHSLQNIWEEQGLSALRSRLYQLANTQEYACVLDSCSLETGKVQGDYQLLVGLGAEAIYTQFSEDVLSELTADWAFGIFPYDLKNKIEKLESSKPSFIPCEEMSWFRPKWVLAVSREGEFQVLKGELQSLPDIDRAEIPTKGLVRLDGISRAQYLDRIREIKELIRDGEVYELNFCLEHRYRFQAFDPLTFQLNLTHSSPVPMASFFKWQQRYLCGASMERFIKTKDDKIWSQPIKGTIRKGRTDEEDRDLRTTLFNSEKDRAENVMIVDLVRNDLNRICETGSVVVDELFGIYGYLQVHQMISTVSGSLKEKGLMNILKALFPMGSMTGAPKVAAMKQIDRLEDFSRNWYSGALGYVRPNGDMDLNVVIRSLICDLESGRLSYSAGGAITIDSSPDGEWKELLLKTKAIEHLLEL